MSKRSFYSNLCRSSLLYTFLFVVFLSINCGPTNYMVIGSSRLPTIKNNMYLNNTITELANSIGKEESLVTTKMKYVLNEGDVGIIDVSQTVSETGESTIYHLGYKMWEMYLGSSNKLVASVLCTNGIIRSVTM